MVFSVVRASLSLAVNPAERGSGGAPGETPNELGASVILSADARQCQYLFFMKTENFSRGKVERVVLNALAEAAPSAA
jgi:hypothetical protein